MLAYLSRYTHRVAIANSRLVALENGRVSFHWKDYRHHDKRKLMTLVDEGLVDFTRLSSPGLGDDVIVTGRSTDPQDTPPAAPAAPAAAPPTSAPSCCRFLQSAPTASAASPKKGAARYQASDQPL